MSDISLHFSPLETAIFFVMLGFIPIAIVTAIVAFWWWRSRSRAAAWSLAIVAVPFLTGAIGWTSLWVGDRMSERRGAAYSAAHARVAASDTRVRGWTLPAGTTYQVEDDAMNPQQATLSRPTSIGGVLVRGDVRFGSEGLEGDATLARDVPVDGAPCKAGPAKFELGRLSACTLARGAVVFGIPCAAGDLDVVDPKTSDVRCTIARAFRFGASCSRAGRSSRFAPSRSNPHRRRCGYSAGRSDAARGSRSTTPGSTSRSTTARATSIAGASSIR